MSHSSEAQDHIEMAKMIAQTAADSSRDARDWPTAAQAATALAVAGLAEAVLHLADQVAQRNN